MTQSPELAGGAGFTFADQISARYLASLLASAPGPGTNERRVSRVALEQRAAGEPLDDIIVDATAPDGSIQRLSLQAKRKLTISAAASNTDFRSIIRDCWATLDKPDFRTGTDYIGAAVGASTAVGTARDLQAVAEFARASATASDFARRFAKGGSASAAHATILGYLEKITREIGREASIEEMYRLLSHFILIRFDTLHAGATDDPATVSLIDQALEPGQDGQAPLLFDRLQTLIRRGAGTARSWSTQTVRREVAPWFRLATNRSLAPDVEKLAGEARQAAESIADRIGDAAIARPALLQRLKETLAKHSLVTIRGLPGSGKSVLLRHAVDEALSNGPAILLKADRLTGNSWGQYASALRVTNSDLGALLGEIAVVGTATLFIDGLDRIDKAQRGIVIDLINMIERSPELSDWRILATLRDSGVEPVRTWLPQLFDGGRMATIQVDGLDEDEAHSLATARPHLKPLLFGGDPVKTLVRRPFFAKILDQAGTLSAGIPRSEVELMAGWWARGGFDAEGGDILLRQRALLRLVRLRALQPETPVSVDTFDSPLLPVVHSLIVDGILEDAGGGHFVRFSHDIFFEWSFAQLLASAGNSWIGELKSAGEPPVIGRAVDLHAQAMFVADQSSWAQNLAPLSDQGLRSQWRRTWLLAPLNHPEFQRKAAAYQATVSADDFALLRMALVWFQAQHTVPNAGVLDGSLGDIKDRSDRLRVADRLGWPDDFWLWMRFLHFIDTRLTTIPRRLHPHVLTLFEVWQNAMADIANPISAMIVADASDWLSELENRRETRARLRIPAEKEAPDPWGDVEDREEFEYALRRLLLRASRTEPDRVRTYLSSFTKERPVGSKTFDDILNFAPLLSQTHAADLVDFALAHFLRELPEDHRARRLEEDRRAAAYRKELRNKPEEELDWSEQMSLSSPSLGYWGPDQWDWEALALERDPGRYFPASPLYQPFSALFDAAPDEALRLIKAMTNHAVEAWRQLHRLQPGRGTPVPIAIVFPWGEQTFWGGVREYLWSRGLWAPKPLASAYLALDRWALDQMTRGADTDALIERIVAGNDSIAALGVALNVAHPLDCVGLETAKVIASLWDIAPQISWAGLGLALELCIVAPDAMEEDMMHNPDGGDEDRQKKLKTALAALDFEPAPLPIPPAPWVRIESRTSQSRARHSTDDNEDWRLADGWWRSDRAGEILRAQPLKVMFAQGYQQPFVDYSRTMLAWTIERKAPSWATRSSDVERSDIFEWTHRFAGLIGGLIGFIDPQTAEDDFLAPICAVTAEDPCFDLLEPLVTMFLCQHMLDVREVASITPVVLRRALDRFLESPTFSRGGYRSGEIYGTSMPDLARWLMFVGFGEAALSCRFANGDWSDINLILPTVGRFVREAGWAPTILQNYLTLTERAGEHFPAEEFADAILATLSSMPDPGSRWRGTQIAARIGARVQVFADTAAPLELSLGQKFLRILDILVDQGDRRSAALQISPAFRDLRLPATASVASGAS